LRNFTWFQLHLSTVGFEVCLNEDLGDNATFIRKGQNDTFQRGSQNYSTLTSDALTKNISNVLCEQDFESGFLDVSHHFLKNFNNYEGDQQEKNCDLKCWIIQIILFDCLKKFLDDPIQNYVKELL